MITSCNGITNETGVACATIFIETVIIRDNPFIALMFCLITYGTILLLGDMIIKYLIKKYQKSNKTVTKND